MTAIINPKASSAALLTKPTGGLGNDDLTLLGSSQVDVIGVISGLRDDSKIRELLEQLSREPCSLTVSDDRIEAEECRRIAKRTGEYLHLGAVAQTLNPGRAVIGAVGIIKYCDPHALPPSRVLVNHQHTAGRNSPKQGRKADVRFGSKADILRCGSDVRFTPKKRTCAVQIGMSALCQ